MARSTSDIGILSDLTVGPDNYVHSNSNWVGNLSSPGMSIPGETVAYTVGDVVHHENSIWVALRDNDNVEPNNNNSSDWELIGNATSRFVLEGANEGEFFVSNGLLLGDLINGPTFNFTTFRFPLASAQDGVQYLRETLDLFQVADAESLDFTVDADPTEFTLLTPFELNPVNANTGAEEAFYILGDPLVLPNGLTFTARLQDFGGQFNARIDFQNVPRTGQISLAGTRIGQQSLRVRSDEVVTGTELRIAPQNPIAGFTGAQPNEFALGINENAITTEFIANAAITPQKASPEIATISDLDNRAFSTREVQRATFTGNTANNPSVSPTTNEVITLRLPANYNSGVTTPFGPATSISLGTTNADVDNLLQLGSPNNVVTSGNLTRVGDSLNTVGFANTSIPETLGNLDAIPLNSSWNMVDTVAFNRANALTAANNVVNSFNAIATDAGRIILIYCNDNNWASYIVRRLHPITNQPNARVEGNAVVLTMEGTPRASQGVLLDNPRIYVADANAIPTQQRNVGGYDFTIDTTPASDFGNVNNFPSPPAPAPAANGGSGTISNSFPSNTGPQDALRLIGQAITAAYGTAASGSSQMAVNVRPVTTTRDSDGAITFYSLDIETRHDNISSFIALSGYGFVLPGGNLIETFRGDELHSVVTLTPPNEEIVYSFTLPAMETRSTFLQRVVDRVNFETPSVEELRAGGLDDAWRAEVSGDDSILFISELSQNTPDLWRITIDHDDNPANDLLAVGSIVEESQGGNTIFGLTPESPISSANTMTTVPEYPPNPTDDAGMAVEDAQYILQVNRSDQNPGIFWNRFGANLVPPTPPNPMTPDENHRILRTLTIGDVVYDIAASASNPRAVAFFADANEDVTLPGYTASDTNPDADHYNLSYIVTVRNVNASLADDVLFREFSLTYGLRGGAMTTLTEDDVPTRRADVTNDEVIITFPVRIPNQTPVGNQRFVFDINFDGEFPDAVTPSETDTVNVSTTLTFTDQRRNPTITPMQFTQSRFATSAAGTFNIDFMQGGEPGTQFDITSNVYNLSINEGPVMNRVNSDSFSAGLVGEDTDYTVSFLLRTAPGSTTTSINGQTTVPDPITVSVDVYTPFFFGTSPDAAIRLLQGTVTQTNLESLLHRSDVEFTNGNTITIQDTPAPVGPSDRTSGVAGDTIYMIVPEEQFLITNVDMSTTFVPPVLETTFGTIEGNSTGTLTIENAVTGNTTLRVVRYGEYTETVTYTLRGRV